MALLCAIAVCGVLWTLYQYTFWSMVSAPRVCILRIWNWRILMANRCQPLIVVAAPWPVHCRAFLWDLDSCGHWWMKISSAGMIA